MIAALLVLTVQMSAAGPTEDVPTGARATAARAEADAFAALEEKRDCDAARSFLRAHALAPDDRLIVNAALALHRFGDRAGALALLDTVRNTPAGVVADATARATALDEEIAAHGPGTRCMESAPSSYSPMLAAGLASVASGVVVGGSTVGTWLWLDQGVLRDPRSSGGAKDAALAARNPVLAVGGSIAGLLVVAGAVLLPFSLDLQEAR